MVDEKYTHIAVIADRSGSMSGIAEDMNGGLKTFLEEQDQLEGTLLLDVTIFDTEVEQIVRNGTVSDVPFPVIVPRGGTALNDAIGITINSLGEQFSKMAEDTRPGKVIVLIITDGYENSSSEYTSTQIKEMVTRQQDEWQWDFVFLGANIDTFAVGGGLGFHGGGTLSYDATAAGVANALRFAGEYVTTSRVVGNASFAETSAGTYVSPVKESN